MAIVSDGSRICDSNRTALAAIDADYTLPTNDVIIILGCGIHGTAVGDRMRVAGPGEGTFTLHFRPVAGTFEPVTDVSVVRLAAAFESTLVNATPVTSITARCNETAVFVAGGLEIDADNGGTSQSAPAIELRDVESLEWQFALNFTGAALATQYEFRGVVVHDAGTTNIDYLAAITTAGAAAGLDQYGFRFRNDDGSEAAATWKAAQNTTVAVQQNDVFRLRVGVNATGAQVSEQFKLQYRKVGTTPWRDIDTQG